MLTNNSNPSSALVDRTFHSMEEVNELISAMGWESEFCQLGRGRVTSRWRSLQLDRYALTRHRLDKSVRARQSAPDGCVALAVAPPPHKLLVEGMEVGTREVLLLGADFQADIVTSDEAECHAFVLPQSDFEASAQALFPRMCTNGEPFSIFRCDAYKLSVVHHETTALLSNGSLSAEDVSVLLSWILDLMAVGSDRYRGEENLHGAMKRRVAKRAQEYIEEHYPETIRLEDLCRSADVSLRTLQRYFSEYFQLSPAAYIKARRLNAARQDLVAARSSRRTVTEIALDSGFSHLGRFSVDYHKHFGESPSKTMALLGVKRTPSDQAEYFR